MVNYVVILNYILL